VVGVVEPVLPGRSGGAGRESQHHDLGRGRRKRVDHRRACRQLGGNLFEAAAIPGIPANRLVFSPHTYGPSVAVMSYFSDSSYPANMPGIWDTLYGHLVGQGFTVVPVNSVATTPRARRRHRTTSYGRTRTSRT